MTRTAEAALALVLSVLGCVAAAGDYGLAVDDSLEVPCVSELTHSRNSCRSAASLADLRAHHLKGDPLRIEAVRVGLAHCSVWFRGDDERATFYRGLVELLATPRITDAKTLVRSVTCFPFRSMRAALEVELARGNQPQEVLARLTEAHAAVMKKYRE